MAAEDDPAAASDYDRGHDAGRIAARLADHDKHFLTINGSLGDVARELAGLTLAVQRLHDQAAAEASTRVATDAALTSAGDARRIAAKRSWSLAAKVFTALVAVAAGIAAAVGVYLAAFH